MESIDAGGKDKIDEGVDGVNEKRGLRLGRCMLVC